MRWLPVSSDTDLEDGQILRVEIEGRSIAVYRLETGELFATDGICTHALAYLADGWLDGDVVECPLHGGCFNVRTGKGLGPPITEDLATYPVRIQEGEVVVGIPDQG